jgi:hypothetical protein
MPGGPRPALLLLLLPLLLLQLLPLLLVPPSAFATAIATAAASSSTTMSRRLPSSGFCLALPPPRHTPRSRARGSRLFAFASMSSSSSPPPARPFKFYHNDVWRVDMPPGHRFPMDKVGKVWLFVGSAAVC